MTKSPAACRSRVGDSCCPCRLRLKVMRIRVDASPHLMRLIDASTLLLKLPEPPSCREVTGSPNRSVLTLGETRWVKNGRSGCVRRFHAAGAKPSRERVRRIAGPQVCRK